MLFLRGIYGTSDVTENNIPDHYYQPLSYLSGGIDISVSPPSAYVITLYAPGMRARPLPRFISAEERSWRFFL